MKPARFLFSIGLFLGGCSLNNSNDKSAGTPSAADRQKIIAFNKFIKKFKPLRLPLTLRTFDLQSTDGLHRITGKDSIFINSGYPNETWAYGFLADTADNFKLIWLSPTEVFVPVLTTFSKQGQKISEQYLGVGQCGSDCCFTCTESVIINKDLTIYSVDSIKSCTCDSSGPKKETMQNSIQFMKGRISPNGQITMSAVQEKNIDR